VKPGKGGLPSHFPVKSGYGPSLGRRGAKGDSGTARKSSAIWNHRISRRRGGGVFRSTGGGNGKRVGSYTGHGGEITRKGHV